MSEHTNGAGPNMRPTDPGIVNGAGPNMRPTDPGIVAVLRELRKFEMAGNQSSAQIAGLVAFSIFMDGEIIRSASVPPHIQALTMLVGRLNMSANEFGIMAERMMMQRPSTGLVLPQGPTSPIPGR